MFKKITVLTKKGLIIENKLIEDLKKMSGGSQLKVISFDSLKKSDLDNSDLIITFGGDGTFIKAANLIEDSLILGVNTEPKTSEGALTSLNLDEIERLREVFLGKFRTISRERIRIKLNGKTLIEKALNEVYIGTGLQFHTSRYRIKFKNLEEEHRSSGILVSTGTGSSAWFYSAGGEIFGYSEKKLGFIVREPYFGKKVFVPKIIKGDLSIGEKLTLESKRDSGGVIVINDSTYDFNSGDVAEIELSDKPLKVIRLN